MRRISDKKRVDPSSMDAWSELMKKAQEGDECAYVELLNQISCRLRLYFQKRIANREEAEELVQEVLLGVHLARHTYDYQKAFSSWLFAIARYKTIDFFRKKKKQPDWVQIESLGDVFFEQEIFCNEKAVSLLADAVVQLTEKQKLIFLGLKLEGLSVKEAALKFNESESNIKVIAHRSYKIVYKWMQASSERGL